MPREQLPTEVTAFIERMVKRAGSARVRREVRREIEAHFEDALEGLSPEEIPVHALRLMSDFGDPRMLSALIRRGKQRCRSPFERFFSMAWRLAAVAMLLCVGGALVEGQFAQQHFKAGLAALERDGLIADVSQLRSTRPPGTTYYAGPDEQSAAAFLLGLEDHPEPRFKDFAFVFNQLSADGGQIPEGLDDIRKPLTDLRPLLDEARTVAALPATGIDPIVRLTRLEGPSEQRRSPSAQAMSLAQCFILEACVRHEDGQFDEALQSLETALQLSEHLRDFPFVVSQMIATNIETSSFKLLGRMGDVGKCSDAAIARFLTHAGYAESERAALSQALATESLTGRRFFHSGTDLLGTTGGGAPAPFAVRAEYWFLEHLYFTPLFWFLSAPDELDYFTRYHDIAQTLKGPYFSTFEQRSGIPHPREISRARRISRIIASIFGPDFVVDQAVCEARAALARTAVDLEQYRRVHGQYPADLAALNAPGSYVDPFTGQPFVYAPSGGQFLLYSRGPDGKSPGGAPGKDDIVWGA